MRVLIDLARGPYILWMDDDSYMLPGWDDALHAFLRLHEPFDCAGWTHSWRRTDEYREFLKQRPWYIGSGPGDAATDDQQISYATGGLFLARTAFLREHEFPDRRMIKKLDDVLLGDLIIQHNGRRIAFSDDLMQFLRINDGERRGTGEGPEGWIVDAAPRESGG